MRVDRKGAEPPQFLSGWKEIANYLGKGVRTVQRYEWELGLPVRRPAGKPRGSVVATKMEIDAWVAASPIRAQFRLARYSPDVPQATWTAITKGMTEMRRLREQMKALRSEVRASVDLLRAGIQGLWGGLNADRWRVTGTADFLEHIRRDHRDFDLSGVSLKHRKAS